MTKKKPAQIILLSFNPVGIRITSWSDGIALMRANADHAHKGCWQLIKVDDKTITTATVDQAGRVQVALRHLQ
jgi:hypothetical protein